MSVKDEKILERIRERYDVACDRWQDIRNEGTKDMRCVAGDPWNPTDRQARKDANRPCLSLDELGQYFNQVINDVRANPRAMKFSPVGNGATDDSAEFYGNKAREIEYRSNAQIAYTTAFENAVQRSYGWVRLLTKYQPRSFNQDIWIEPVHNPDYVLPDPDAVRPDSSDMKYLFYAEAWRREEFTRKFSGATITDFGQFMDQGKLYTNWFKTNTVVVAEYWEIQTEESELLQLRDTQTGQVREVLIDDLAEMPKGWVVIQRRPEDVSTVMQYLTNGVEILGKPKRWAGKFIPFASCFGKVIYVDEGKGAERKILSMTRLARDPYMLYCYYRTCEAELVGMTPKTPFIGYVGQFRGQEKNWQKVNHEPIAYLEAAPFTEATGQTILPLPQRQPYEPPIAALEIGAEAARRAIQAAMGSNFLPTQAQRKNEKSGVALEKMDQSAQRGTYHFIDHYDDMIRQVGVMIEDLIDKVIDTPREVGIRQADETAKMVMAGGPPGVPDVISTQGDHLVTISTGPAYDSQRQQASDFADTIVQTPLIAQVSGPQAAAKVLSLAVKLKNLGEIGDQIADTISPPESDNGEPNPAALQQENMQLKQMLQQATQVTQQMQMKIETDEVKEQATTQREMAKAELQEQGENQRTAAEIQSKERIAMRELEVKLEIEMAKLGSAQSMKRAELEQNELHRHSEVLMQREAQEAASAEAEMNRQADRDSAQMEAAQNTGSEAQL